MPASGENAAAHYRSGSPALEYWGLCRYPFLPVPKLGEFLDIGTHGESLRRLLHGLQEVPVGYALVGPRGVGKTTLLAVFGEMLGQTVVPAWLKGATSRHQGVPRAGAVWLLDGVAVLDVPALVEASRGENRKVVVAVRWPPGDPFARYCHRVGLERIELRPWSRPETELAIGEAMGLAGAVRPLFTPRALASVFEATAGIPRRVARVVNLALVLGAARRVRWVSEREVEAAAEELRTLCSIASSRSFSAAPSRAA